MKLSNVEQSTVEEELDFQMLKFIQNDLLVFFGRPNVEDSFLNRLIQILVRVAGDELNQAPIPLNFTMESTGTQSAMNSATRLYSPAAIPQTPIQIPDLEVLNLDDPVVPSREKVSLHCLQILFEICADSGAENHGTYKFNSGTDSDLKVAYTALPILIEKCKSVLLKYTIDRPISGKMPMPRYRVLTRSRNVEVIKVLMGLYNLNVRTSSVSLPYGQAITETLVKEFLMSTASAHLFQLYPVLCEFLSVVSGSIFLKDAMADAEILLADEAQMADLVRKCLLRVGNFFS